MFFLPLLLSGALALGAGATGSKLSQDQCSNLKRVIELVESQPASLQNGIEAFCIFPGQPQLARFQAENEELYSYALTSDMGDVSEDVRDKFLQIEAAENKLNSRKRKILDARNQGAHVSDIEMLSVSGSECKLTDQKHGFLSGLKEVFNEKCAEEYETPYAGLDGDLKEKLMRLDWRAKAFLDAEKLMKEATDRNTDINEEDVTEEWLGYTDYRKFLEEKLKKSNKIEWLHAGLDSTTRAYIENRMDAEKRHDRYIVLLQKYRMAAEKWLGRYKESFCDGHECI